MLEVTEIPDSGKDHPNPPHPCLMKHEFTLALIAPKGAGKTTLLINLLKFYKGYFHKIIVFSPTVKKDEKWKYAKSLVLLKQNTELVEALAKIQKEKNKESIVPYDPPKFLLSDPQRGPPKKFTGKIDPEFFIADYTVEDLEDIIKQQAEMIEYLEKFGYTKHTADRILIVADDVVAAGLYSNAKNDKFKGLNTRHRHESVSIIMVTQAYKEIPKTVRSNFTGFIIFKINSDNELKVIYEEYPLGFTKNEWYDMYKECTDEKHGFMYFDLKKPPGQQIMCCFKYIVGNRVAERNRIKEEKEELDRFKKKAKSL